MTADLQSKSYVSERVLYMAMELSNSKWLLAFGDGACQRQVGIAAGDIAALSEQIANKLIEQLEAGAAPWQKPWAPGSIHLPHNPVSGTRYKGSNAMWLEMQGRGDPRCLGGQNTLPN